MGSEKKTGFSTWVNYPSRGEPWADFLHHRSRVLAMWQAEGKSPEESARLMSMDPGQVRLILASLPGGNG